MSSKKEIREQFKREVFAQTNGKCCVPGCGADAVDAHHIMDRSLYSDGGYRIGNGAALCEKHHQEAESGKITPLDCMYYMKLTFEEMPVPDKLGLTSEEFFELLEKGRIDKWGK